MISLAYYFCSPSLDAIESTVEEEKEEDLPTADEISSVEVDLAEKAEEEQISTIASLPPNILDIIINKLSLRDFLAVSLTTRHLYHRIYRYCKYRLDMLAIYIHTDEENSTRLDCVVWKDRGEPCHVPESIILDRPFHYEQVIFIFETPQLFHFEKICEATRRIRSRVKEISIRIDGPDVGLPPWTVSDFEWTFNRTLGRPSYTKEKAKRRAESEFWKKAEMNCFCSFGLETLDSFLKEIAADSLALPCSISPLSLLTLPYISKMSLVAEIDYTAADLGSHFHQNRFLQAYDTPCRLVIRSLVLAAGGFFDLRHQIYTYERRPEEKTQFEDWLKTNAVRDISKMSASFVHIKKTVYVACEERKIILFTTKL